MATLDFQSADRTEPLVISIKRVGDSTERFISRNGSTVAFASVTGDNIAYEMTITDATGRVTTAQFTQSCQRPADCEDGPELTNLIAFSRIGLTYQFHGANVQKIRRDIVINNVIVDTAIDEPTSSIVETVFKAPLANGEYEVRISGESCYSGELPSARQFVITDDSSELDWWPNYPRFDFAGGADKFRILLSVTKAGVYDLVVKDSTDFIWAAGNPYLSPGEIFILSGFDPETYDITLGILTATLVIDEAPAECTAGPELDAVTSLSPTQTEFVFDGINVFVIEWFIRNTSDVIEHTGTVEPGGGIVTINHPPLSGGTHNLLIRGSSCTSQSGIIDNLDFNVTVGSLSLGTIVVVQQPDGRYKLTVNFSGGSPNYTIRARTQANNVIATFPNTTGSPANVTLPAGTSPQTIKLAVIDSNDVIVENTNVVLPAPVAKLNFLQADNFISIPTETPMPTDGATYFIGAPVSYNWDVEFELPNGGLWDYIEKRVRKLESGNFVEKNLAAATSNPQNYSVGPAISSERMFLPRTGTQVNIDGVSVYKNAATWEFRFIARKGGPGGAIVAQITRVFTISAPPGPSGIFLYNRSASSIGSEIAEIPSVGGSYDKPTPFYDIVVKDYSGTQFDRQLIRFSLKIGNEFVQQHSNDLDWGVLRSSIAPNEHSLFFAGFPTSSSTAANMLAQQAQTWRVETIAYNTSNQVVATRQAIFDFGVADTEFSSPGMDRKTIAGRDYVMTNGMDFGATPDPVTGNMKLYHPANRQSINGQSTCYPWVYYNHVRMDATDLAAFRSGPGLAFPPAIHTFSIKWHSAAVANYDDVIDGGGAGNAYNLAGEQLQVSGGYSGMDDYFTFSIID